jgi:L-ascorbate metabolism protein UlaG (beta-lactamase superfamily)
MNLTYYGHSCFSVETGRHTLLFDPFISGNPLASAIDLNSLKADYILLSHGHSDHVLDATAIANRTGATIIAGFEVAVWMAKQSVRKTHPINHGSTLFDFGRLRYVNAVHSSSMPDGSYGGQAGGFVVEAAEGNFYYSGDTALTSDMELIGAAAPLTFAVLCLGGNFTMDEADALVAAEMVQCDEIVGVHYDTFPQIKIDHQQAKRRFQEAGKTLHLLKIGESRKFQ